MIDTSHRFLEISVAASGPVSIHIASRRYAAAREVVTLDRADAAALVAALLPVVSNVRMAEPAIYKDGLLHLNTGIVANDRDDDIVTRVADIEAGLARIDARLARIERWREGDR